MEELYEIAIKGGWRITTNFGLVLQSSGIEICQSSLIQPRRNFTPAWLFKQILTDNTCGWLASEVKFRITADTPSTISQHGTFTIDEMRKLLVTFLLAIVEPATTWTSFVRKEDRQGVSCRRLERFIKYLGFDTATWFKLLNKDIKGVIKPGEEGALDETMWPWLGDHPTTVHIERKPEPDGFKVLTLCLQLTYSERYVCQQINSNN